MSRLLFWVKRRLRAVGRAGFAVLLALLFFTGIGCASASKQKPPDASQPVKTKETVTNEDEKSPTFNDLRGYLYPARKR